MRRREQRRITSARGEMEVERLSRLSRLTPLITSYGSLSEGQKAEVATSLQNIIKDFPVDQCQIDKATFELETDRSNLQPEYTDTPSPPDVPPLPVTRDDAVDSALDEVTSDLSPFTVATESINSEPPMQTMPDQPKGSPADQPEGPQVDQLEGSLENQPEGSLVHGPTRVSSMLAILYSSFLASVRQMGVLLSPRTVIPRPEDQDDETEVTQELSQAQRRLVMEEEFIWNRLSEMVNKEGTGEDVFLLARELEDKSSKILTSYERRKNPPTSEVYDQSRIILQAMGVPCINAKGGVEGEALAAAIVRDGLADYVASEDTVRCFTSL